MAQAEKPPTRPRRPVVPGGLVHDVQIDYDSPLGRGSDAIVFEGSWDAPVAVKVLHEALIAPDVQAREQFIARFVEECQRMRELRHVNIVQFFGVLLTRSGAPALVTERLAKTLEKHYETNDISLTEALLLFLDITAGLACIHAHGLVHRDLTTRNVLLTAGVRPRAKIADVGVSKRIHGDNLASYASLTQCPGTLLYMPPEALSDPPTYDERLDSFSFGLVMMATLLKREPSGKLFHAERFERLPNGTRRAIPEIERRKSDFDAICIPADHPLKSVFRRCLDNDSARRPTAAELHVELMGIAKNLGIAHENHKVGSSPGDIVNLTPEGSTIDADLRKCVFDDCFCQTDSPKAGW